MALRKKVSYVGLKDLPYDLVDTDPLSLDFFRIVDFPDNFQAGKNLFKLRAHPTNFADGAEIYIEILDYNGTPIYYEPLKYREADGTRVVSVYIYPDTSPGPAVVYLASRAKVNPDTGEQYPFSSDGNSPNFKQIPNLLWQRPITVQPLARNNNEIIYTRQPTIAIREVVQPYLQPVDVFNVQTTVTGSGGASVTCTPVTTAPPQVELNTSPFDPPDLPPDL